MQQQQQKNVGSEVARLRDLIARECQAANWALTGLADGHAKHRFISRRYDRIGACQSQLAGLVGEQASMHIVVEVINGSDPKGGAHE